MEDRAPLRCGRFCPSLGNVASAEPSPLEAALSGWVGSSVSVEDGPFPGEEPKAHSEWEE